MWRSADRQAASMSEFQHGFCFFLSGGLVGVTGGASVCRNAFGKQNEWFTSSKFLTQKRMRQTLLLSPMVRQTISDH